ncbi:MAG: DUF5977 domain-containing protein [Sphingobacteriales bacterium]
MPIGPVTDAYIDSIINANDPYNPNLNKTQGVQLRALIKLLRDRLEQETGLISITYADLSTLVNASGLTPGQLYLLTDYATVFHQPVTDTIITGTAEPLLMEAVTVNTFSGVALSTLNPGDIIRYDFNNNTVIVTPAVTQPRNGWITYREDVNGNAACFDWRKILFRRFAADLTGVPAWSKGGSYPAGSFVTNNGTVYGLLIDINNDSNDSLDTSPTSPYIPLFDQGAKIFPLLTNPIGPFSTLPGDTANFADLPAINVAGANQRLGSGTSVYQDSLPNVVLADNSTEIVVADSCSDLHFDNCTFCTIGTGVSSSIFQGTNFLEAGSQATSLFGTGSTGINIGPLAANLAVLQANYIRLGATSTYNVVYSSSVAGIAEGSSGNVIQGCQNAYIGEACNNNNLAGGQLITIGGGGNSNNIKGNNIKLGVNCSGNTIGTGSTDITFHGANNSNTIGNTCSGIELGIEASNYTIGNTVIKCYFTDTSGATIPDGSTGLVPWQTPAGGFTPGNWSDVSSKSTDIENETSPIQYKIDGVGQEMIVYIGAQFTIKTEFSGNAITLGVVGAGAYPVSPIKKYITVLDSTSGNPFGAFLTIDTAGNLGILVVPGFSGNLPNGAGTVYFIDMFYKPTVPVYYFTKTAGFTTQGCSAPLVGTQIPYTKIYQSYISVADAQNNVAVADSAAFNSEGQANANSLGSCIPSPVVQNVVFSVTNNLVNYYHESTVAAFNSNVFTHLAVIVLMDGEGNVQASVPVPPGTSEWLQSNVNTGWNIAVAIQQTIEVVSPKSVSINTVSMVAGVTDLGAIAGTLNDSYRWLMTSRNIGTATEIDITVSDDTDAGVPVLLKNEMGSTPFFPKLNLGLYSNFTHNIGESDASYPSDPNNWFTEFRWVPDNWTALSINVGGESFTPIADLYARRSGGDVLLYQYNTYRVDQLLEANDIFVLKKSTGDPTNHRIKVTDDRTNSSDPIVVAFFDAAQQGYVVMQPGDTAYGRDYNDSNIDVLIYTHDIALQTANRLNVFAVFNGTTYHYADDGRSFLLLSTLSNGGERVISIQD